MVKWEIMVTWSKLCTQETDTRNMASDNADGNDAATAIVILSIIDENRH